MPCRDGAAQVYGIPFDSPARKQAFAFLLMFSGV